MDCLTIDRISVTKRGRYALFTGEEFLFSVDEETLVREHLKEAMVLPVVELEELRRRSETRKACDKAMDYLSRRDHSCGELYQKLTRKYDPESAAAAVEKMRELGLVDDLAFACRYASRLAEQSKSRSQIRQALAQKGLGRELISAALEQLAAQEDEDAEWQAIHHLIQRSYRQKLALGQTDKVVAALCRRGFPTRAVWEAVRQYCEPESEYFEE